MDSRHQGMHDATFGLVLCAFILTICCIVLCVMNGNETSLLRQRVVRLEAQVRSQDSTAPSEWDKQIHNREQDLEYELEGYLHTKDPHELHEFLDGKEW